MLRAAGLVAAATLACAAAADARHTPTPPPPAGAPTELVFPASPGAPSTTLPEHACGDPSPSATCASLGGFNRSDYEGWATLNGANERMAWQLDPAGSGKTVAELDVYGTDTADQYGGTRTSLWRNADNCSGCEAWQAFGVYLPPAFVFPDTWFLLYQDFSSGGNPAQALELMGAGCVSAAPRNHFCWKDQTAPSTGKHYVDLGLAQLGHWTYLLENIRFAPNSTGFDKVWVAVDVKPDPATTPLAVNWSGITAYDTNPNRSNVLLYRDPSSAAQHQTVDYCGFHRAADALTASMLSYCPAP